MFQRTLYLLVETLCPPRLSALPPQAGVDPLRQRLRGERGPLRYQIATFSFYDLQPTPTQSGPTIRAHLRFRR